MPLLILVLLSWFNVSAQKNSNLQLKIETGLVWASDEGKAIVSDFSCMANKKTRLLVQI